MFEMVLDMTRRLADDSCGIEGWLALQPVAKAECMVDGVPPHFVTFKEGLGRKKGMTTDAFDTGVCLFLIATAFLY